MTIEKAGMPPLKYWLKNRKGDCWARVVLPDGSRKWARLRGGFYTGKEPLTRLGRVVWFSPTKFGHFEAELLF